MAIAIVGAALGVWNTIASFRRNRISLRVIPKLYDRVGGAVISWDRYDPKFHSRLGLARFCIEVQNTGRVAVTIDEVGFTQQKNKMHRFVIIEPLLSDGSKLPKRLEPLDSVVAYGNQTPMDFHALSEVKAAYAETGNGRIFTGTSQMLNHLVNVAKEGGINKA